ncbi:MAG: sodium-translocating pyrophosphatase [Pirellulaceae bacterium]|nr:sodium-translocating pyrophosphatase [Pirellulaceae bacterium]
MLFSVQLRRHLTAAFGAFALVCFSTSVGFSQETTPTSAIAQAASGIANAPVKPPAGGEASMVLPDLNQVKFIGGFTGSQLLYVGLVVSALGLGFGLQIYRKLQALPVHSSMLEVSELIYATCKTYLLKQGAFIALLWVIIASVIVFHFYGLLHFEPFRVGIIVAFSVVGILGSYAVAWFGIRVNTFANSRTAFASLKGLPYPVYAIPLQAGMSIGMMLISVELLIMLCILLFVPGEYAGPCFIGFAIGESLGAAALRIAGGIFTKIADIGADLMKIVFKIDEDDARNPGVIADCVGDNAGDSVGPSADGFETYGVTGVALISFILLAINPQTAGAEYQNLQVQLLVWIFVMRVMMVIASAASYYINEAWTYSKYVNAIKMNFEMPLTRLVWLTSIISIIATYLVSWLIVPSLLDDTSLWWKLSTIISCGTIAGALIPELVKVFTSTNSKHVSEVVTSSREGGASLNILSGLVAGNFSCFWLGIGIVGLMSIAYGISTLGLANLMVAPAVFAFGLVAFGFLGMGPVTIAVDSYGPVTDNAQSVYELSLIEDVPNIEATLQRDFNIQPNFKIAKELLEENDGTGNTFKATAKPVLIGTAVVGATTMIFSIIMHLTHGLTVDKEKLSLLHAPFVLGLISGGAMVYWFTGASMQAVTTGAYRAVQFIKEHMRLDGAARASVEDSKKVVAICTTYAQRGMFVIFLALFFLTLGCAFVEPFFFIGYLMSIAISGLYQAIFMANAGGAWDNAKKIVEVNLKMKGTPLHDATVVGDTVGDPFKDTCSVALNPVIKFTTLFGLLAVEVAEVLRHNSREQAPWLICGLATLFLVLGCCAVWYSFYGMRIGTAKES